MMSGRGSSGGKKIRYSHSTQTHNSRSLFCTTEQLVFDRVATNLKITAIFILTGRRNPKIHKYQSQISQKHRFFPSGVFAFSTRIERNTCDPVFMGGKNTYRNVLLFLTTSQADSEQPLSKGQKSKQHFAEKRGKIIHSTCQNEDSCFIEQVLSLL